MKGITIYFKNGQVIKLYVSYIHVIKHRDGSFSLDWRDDTGTFPTILEYIDFNEVIAIVSIKQEGYLEDKGEVS